MTDAHTTREEFLALSDLLTIVGTLAGGGIGVLLMIQAADDAMALHGAVFAVAGLVACFFLIGKAFDNGTLAGPNFRRDIAFYNDGVVKAGTIATVFWGIVGFLVGVVIAWQLAFPVLNLDLPWTTFGRLRPLHTSAVIFAFGGNALIATSFYVVQRTSRARLAGRWAPWFVFWGYQLFLVIAASGYVLGVSQGKEYAEPEWYADLWLTIVWVVYLLVFLGTLARRKEPHIYVANWFYLAFILTIAVLHLGNNAAIPVSPFS
jgi:cytochrome c oxidase cbb3-type subunit 1